ncbi:MAG: lysozyme [Henriciella sp.]|uniref:lysozyme n=1 Tax=Henriciella sp. TaxID=1968823 RepID=UPI003C7172F0
MASDLRTSETGLKLIMAYEGFRPVSKQLPDGRWVIGYGHLKAARANQKISQQEAAAILREYDLRPVERALHELILIPVNQSEFDALVSFAFNIGLDRFEGSEVLAQLNAGNKLKAAAAMESWRKARVGSQDMIVDPLVRRRADEKALFLKTSGAVPLAASSRFRPVADEETDAPERRATEPRQAKPFVPPARLPQREEETAPEAAARTVRERLTRILGEEEAGATPAADADEETLAGPYDASVEEIRKAVSALVSDHQDEEKDSGPITGDIELEEIVLDEPPGGKPKAPRARFDYRPGQLEVEDSSVTRRKGAILIDDVTPAEIDPELVRKAGAQPQSQEGPVEIVLFGLVALLGAGLFAFGGASEFGWFGGETAPFEGLLAYLPPFLMLAGGLLFLIMSYYCVRAIASPAD